MSKVREGDGFGLSKFVKSFCLPDVDAGGNGLGVNNKSVGGGFRGEGYNPSFENADEYPPSQQPVQPNPLRSIDLST